jgi:nicotinamidase-related amidase
VLEVEKSFLLVVDVQERLAPAVLDGARTIFACTQLIRAARKLEVPLLISEENPRGLGRTVGEIAALAGDAEIIDKVHFSCLADKDMRARIEAWQRPQAVIAGMEAHVCVLQTALDLLDDGYRTAVVADAVSSRTAANKQCALDRLAASGVEIVSLEMVLFEWLRTAQHPLFREILALIKLAPPSSAS